MSSARAAVLFVAAALVFLVVTFADGGFTANDPSHAPTVTPIELLGDGIGPVRFGTNAALAVSRLNALLTSEEDAVSTGVRSEVATGDCNIDSFWSWSAIQIFVVGQDFVGYSTQYLRGVMTDNQVRIQGEFEGYGGLRLTDTLSQARALYRGAFTVSAARGGSWSAATRTGTLYGSLLSPPAVTGLSDVVDRIAAGDTGC